jgi:hypothetical protein
MSYPKTFLAVLVGALLVWAGGTFGGPVPEKARLLHLSGPPVNSADPRLSLLCSPSGRSRLTF